jgi:hypothetical protein
MQRLWLEHRMPARHASPQSGGYSVRYCGLRMQRPTIPADPAHRTVAPWRTGGPPAFLQIRGDQDFVFLAGDAVAVGIEAAQRGCGAG